ncbi:MAG: SDR family oxidoreductase [Candidatus Tectomicrobia bacterium]|nr:SDR family oxidoreductase [Candidatus Tectomicrobia bacterium]
MELGLAGKIAIVTGGSKGIGKATALALAQEGAQVAICARGLEDLQETAREIESATGQSVFVVQSDMTRQEDIQELVATTASRLGGIDILVNNAVNSVPGLFMELPDEAWVNHITVKILGYVRCAREAIPHMQRRGGGRIINIGGMAARQVGHLTNTNGVTNASVANITKNLADQVAADQILVNCIHPGSTRTPRQTRILERRAQDMGVSVDEAEQVTVSHIPIGRMIEPEDVANLILFFVSAQASAITGQVIAVDGGAGRGMNY